MRHFLHNHLAVVVYAPLWAAITWAVYACCGLGR